MATSRITNGSWQRAEYTSRCQNKEANVQPRSARVTGRDWVDGRTTTRNRGKRNVQDEVLRLEVGIELLGENRERADAPGVHVPELDCVKTERSSVLLKIQTQCLRRRKVLHCHNEETPNGDSGAICSCASKLLQRGASNAEVIEAGDLCNRQRGGGG